MPRRIMLWSIALALAGLAGACAAAGAAAWILPPTPLAPSANGPSGAVVAVDPGGDAVAAWTHDDGAGTQSLLVATRPAGGGWSAATPLAQRAGVDAPAVAIDAGGTATVVWIDSADGSAFAAHAARGDVATGTWGATHDFVAAGIADPQTQVRAGAAGDVVAAWVEHDPGSGVAFVRAATFADGAWDAERMLSDPADATVAFAPPQIAPDASGGAIVGWTAQRLADPFDFAIQTSTRGAGGFVAASPADLVTSGEALSPLRLVGADGGEAAASWFQGSPATLWGGLRTSGAWTVDDVSADVAPACTPLQALGADDDGGATVVWKAQSSDGLEAVRLTAGGWEPSDNSAFASRTESAEDAAVERGTVVLVAHDAGTDGDSVVATRRDAGGAWSAPALLDAAPAGTSLGGVDLATDADGDALASWSATGALGAKSAALAALQVGGPRLSDLSVPASAAPREQLAFSVTARSAFATVAQTTWDFGDGSAPASGATASHAYAQAGDYTVTVSSTDGVGNVTQARRPVAVAAPPGPAPPGPTPPGPTPPGGRSLPPPRALGALERPRIAAPGGVLLLQGGARTLALVVRNPNAARLQGSAALVQLRGGRRAALPLAGGRRLAFPARRRTTISLRLSDRALRALRRASGHRLPVRISLRLRAADGRIATASRTATLDGAPRFGSSPPKARSSC